MNLQYLPKELQIGIDIGSVNHSVAIGDGYGNPIQQFEIEHNTKGFNKLISIIDKEAKERDAIVHVAMEGYNGWARPLDSILLEKGYKLYNVNNVKLARFKEIFPAPQKSDRFDAQKILELFSLQKHLPVAKKVLQEIMPFSNDNVKLKKLTRRRRQLVDEKVAISNRFSTDLQAVCPELRAITNNIDSLRFLRFFTLKEDIRELVKVTKTKILKINRLGEHYYNIIHQWQKEAAFAAETELIASMLYEDATRILELKNRIKQLENEVRSLIPNSTIARVIDTIPGFSTVTAGELAGEIGNIERFKSEASLALYIGMTNLNNDSGKKTGTKRNFSTNRHAKMAMTTAIMKHTQHVEQSKKYLEKKISEGKKYQQAIRSIGRHLVRVIWSMIQNDRDKGDR